jgi:hypothetical protein
MRPAALDIVVGAMAVGLPHAGAAVDIARAFGG